MRGEKNMTTLDYVKYKEALHQLRKPCMLLDLNALDKNIELITQKVTGKKIRIASKSIRSIEVLRYILQKDSIFQGIMSYSGEEAIFLLEQGFNDILLGYPIWHIEHIKALLLFSKQNKKVVFMVDSIAHVNHIHAIAESIDTTAHICIDIDMSVSYPLLHFGVRRSPIHSWEQLNPLVEHIKSLSTLKIVGIMGYEAQIAGVGDAVPKQPVKNRLIRLLKHHSIKIVKQRRERLVSKLIEEGIKLELVNAGGTGSLSSSSKETYVTEVTVGSGFYTPLLFDYYKSFRYQPALSFVLEVARKPTENIVTCSGGGYMASGAIGWEKSPQPYMPKGLALTSLEGVGEVQTPLLTKHCVEPLELGDPIFFRHAKAGELCEHFNEMVLIRNNELVGQWKTYRGEGGCFL